MTTEGFSSLVRDKSASVKFINLPMTAEAVTPIKTNSSKTENAAASVEASSPVIKKVTTSEVSKSSLTAEVAAPVKSLLPMTGEASKAIISLESRPHVTDDLTAYEVLKAAVPLEAASDKISISSITAESSAAKHSSSVTGKAAASEVTLTPEAAPPIESILTLAAETSSDDKHSDLLVTAKAATPVENRSSMTENKVVDEVSKACVPLEAAINKGSSLLLEAKTVDPVESSLQVTAETVDDKGSCLKGPPGKESGLSEYVSCNTKTQTVKDINNENM